MLGLLARRESATTLPAPGAAVKRLMGARLAPRQAAKEETVMETLQAGELVMSTEAPFDTRGRVVAVSDDGRTVTVHWELRPGYEDQDSTEDAALLRRVHESEEGMAAA
jgi:hypothetical protein